MALIGMPEAARRAGYTHGGLKHALQHDPEMAPKLVRINARALAIEESDLAEWIAKRGPAPGPGRPKGVIQRPGA